MTDYYNDPPEIDEMPECCGEYMEPDQMGSCVCYICGKVIEPAPDIEPADLLVGTDPEPENYTCPHGLTWLECDTCFDDGGFAFDVARERKHFGH